jgi:phosphate transport system substrate-binding protein
MMVGSVVVTTATSATPTYYPLTLQAGGSTFVNPVMQVWATDFAQYTSGAVKTNYQAVGSGAGITGIESNTFGFAGSDAPVSAAAAAPYVATNGPLLQFPEALGGVAIFYNVPGVTVSLNFTGSVLANIYLGTITMWNDPAIQALNPGCHAGSTTCVLPAETITPVHRSDGSGTTYALSNYFEKVSTAWNASFSGGCPCYGTSISWPSSEIGAKGSSGVAAYVNENPYTIGYADSYYAFSNGLKAAAIQNQAGVFLAPTLADIAAAANAFSAQVQANPTFTITNAPGASSYPISTFTYLLVWANQQNQQMGSDMAQLFEWIVNQGQAYGPGLYYPSLPANVVAIDQSIIKQMNYKGVSFINTSTTVSCNHASVVVGSSVTCKATVVGSAPTGSATWSSISGTFSKLTCNLSKGACTVKFTPTAAGSVLLTASYGSDSKNSPSAGTYDLAVTMKPTKTAVSCTPKSGSVSSSTSITCTAKVTGYSPTGTVTWSQTGTGAVTLSSTTCTLTKGTTPTTGACSVTMTAKTAGKVTLTASYGGDSNNQASLHAATLTIKS